MDGKQQSPPQYQVFINFRGDQLRNNFIGHLVKALRGFGINVFIDTDEQKGKDIKDLLKRIDESRVALVIFSTRYTESTWCLEELATIKKRVDLGMLEVLPIFYKVPTGSVKLLLGEFGDHFRRREWEYRFEQSKIDGWKKALVCVAGKIGLPLDEKSSESDFIGLIVTHVLQLLAKVSLKEQTAKSQAIQLSGKAPHKTTQPRESVGYGAGGSVFANPTSVPRLVNVPSGQYPTIPSWLGSSSSFLGGNSAAPANSSVPRLGSHSVQASYSNTNPHYLITTNGSTLGAPTMQGTNNMGQHADPSYATGNALLAQNNQLVSGLQRPQQPHSTVRPGPRPSWLPDNYNAQYGQGQFIYKSKTSFNGVTFSDHTIVLNPSSPTTMPPTSHFPPV